MKKINLVVLIFLVLCFSCKKSEEATIETVKPNIEITFPQKNAQFYPGDEMTLTATMTDKGGLAQLNADVTFKGENDDAWTPEKKSITVIGISSTLEDYTLFFIPKDAIIGDYTLTLTVIDKAGNKLETKHDFAIIRKAPDTEAPEITIVTPVKDAIYLQGEQISFTGKVSDNIIVTDFEINISSTVAQAWKPTAKVITLNQKVKEYTEPELLFTIPEDATPGQYDIYFKAIDNSNSSSTERLFFTIKEKIVDSEKPTIIHTTPENDATYIQGEAIIVKGKVTDDVKLKEVNFTLSSNAVGAWAPNPFVISINAGSTFDYDQTVFTIPVDAKAGDYTLTIQGTDWKDKKSDPTVINITVKETEDTTNPTIDVTLPTEQAAYKAGDKILLSGTFADNKGIQKLTISVTPMGYGNTAVQLKGAKGIHWKPKTLSFDFTDKLSQVYTNKLLYVIPTTAKSGNFSLVFTLHDTNDNETIKEIHFSINE